MIDFDFEDFERVVDGEKKYFDMFFEWSEDPVARECIKAFLKGVGVSMVFATVRHGVYQYRRYKEQTLTQDPN